MTEQLKIELRKECYTARRAIRSSMGAEKWLTKHFKANGGTTAQGARVRRLVEILPPLLSQHCIAKAEAMAIDQIVKETTR